MLRDDRQRPTADAASDACAHYAQQRFTTAEVCNGPAAWHCTPPSRGTLDEFQSYLDFDLGVRRARLGKHPQLTKDSVQNAGEYFGLKMGRLSALARIRNDRQTRSELRFAETLVAREIAERCDYRTLQIVTPKGGYLIPISVAQIAANTGLRPRRVERALHDLSLAGYIRTLARYTRTKRPDGTVEIVNETAVRWVSLSFFEDLGLKHALRDARRYRSNRQKRAEAAQAGEASKGPDDAAAAEYVALAAGTLDVAGQKRKAAHRAQITPTVPAAPASDLDIKVIKRAGQLFEQHPGWGRDRCYAEARREYGVVPPDD